MKIKLTVLIFIGVTMSQAANSCIPEVQKSKPPRLVNGQWVEETKPNVTELISIDFEKLKKHNHAFVFSGIYSKEATFNNKAVGFIKTKKVWQGKVPKTVDIDRSKPPTDNSCTQLQFGQEYIFFAALGNRNKPLLLKSFRKTSSELLTLLGKPSKQWLRGRLINRK